MPSCSAVSVCTVRKRSSQPPVQRRWRAKWKIEAESVVNWRSGQPAPDLMMKKMRRMKMTLRMKMTITYDDDDDEKAKHKHLGIDD